MNALKSFIGGFAGCLGVGCAVFFVLVMLVALGTASERATPKSPEPKLTPPPRPSLTPTAPPSPAALRRPRPAVGSPDQPLQEAPPDDTHWRYTETPDSLGQGTVTLATVRSLNTITLSFPYEGPQRATLTLRDHPRFDKSAMFAIERGQILHEHGLTISFDGAPPQRFDLDRPTDYDSKTVFIHDYPTFYQALANSQRCAIQVTLFKESPKTFNFDLTEP